MTDEQQDAYAKYIARLLELPPGDERDRMLETLRVQTFGGVVGDDVYDDVRRLVQVADLVWLDAHRAPALEDDAVAAMLGLVPDAGYRLDPTAFKRARAAARMEPTTIADVLTKRGWTVSAGDVFNWEIRGAASVPPALIRAVAQVLNTNPDRLTAPTSRLASAEAHIENATQQAAASPRFVALVARFARIQGMTEKMAASALQSRMLATVHRGEHPTADQTLSSVEALVDALESDDIDR